MSRRTSIATQGLIIVLLLLFVELFLVRTIYNALQDTRDKLAKEQHVFDVLAVSNRIANATQKLATLYFQDAMKMSNIIGETPDKTPYQNQLSAEFAEFRGIAEHDEKAKAILKEQQNLLKEAQNLYVRASNYRVDRRTPEDNKFVEYVLSSGDLSAAYDRLLTQYRTSEGGASNETSESISAVEHTILFAVVLNLVLGMGLAYFFIKRVANRVGRLTDNVSRFQLDEPLLPKMIEGDEIGKLDDLFHQMVTAINDARHNEETLVEDAYDVICTIDSEGTFVALNEACKRQWGYEKEALLGQHFDEVIDSADCLAVNQYLDSLKNKSSSSVNFSARIKRASGDKVDSTWSCYWSHKDKSAFCFVRDETEVIRMETMLKAREEQVRALMRNIPIGLMVVDGDGVIKSANHKIEKFMNFQRGTLMEQNINKFLVAAGEQTKNQEQLNVLTLAKEVGSLTCNLRSAEGELLPAEVMVKTLDAADSIDTLVLVEDIRERVRLENMKKAFVALLRESLRAPLLKVRDMLSTAGESSSEKTIVRRNRVVSNSDRLLRLIDELLSVESLRPGKIVGDLKLERIENIVEAAIELLKDYSAKQGVGIRVEPVSAPVMADFDRLVQVIVNLLSNAIKFSPAGSEVVVTVRAQCNDTESSIEYGETKAADTTYSTRDGAVESRVTSNDTGNGGIEAKGTTYSTKYGVIEVSITDSGRGVPLELQESIFKPYVQASSGDRIKGTGLGLPICRTIVESHGGTIGVTSEGEGSTFWFRIPKVGEDS